MATYTVRYVGTQDRWPELAVTGKPSVWHLGQAESRDVSEATLLLRTGLFERIDDDYIDKATAEKVQALVSEPGDLSAPSGYSPGPWISNVRSMAPSKLDGVVLYTCQQTSGSNVLNCSDGAFTSADIGKSFLAYNMDATALTLANKLTGTITGVNSATQITVSANAAANVTSANGRLVYGTDRAAEIQGLLNDARSKGGYFRQHIGLAVCGSNIVVPGGVVMEGSGRDYPSTREFLNRGSALIRVGTYDVSGAFVTLGDALTNYGSNYVKPEMIGIGVDAAERCSRAVSLYAARARVRECTIWRGMDWAVACNDGDPWLIGNVIAQMNVGGVVWGTGDMHLFDNHIRGSGNGGHQIYLRNVSDARISRNHMFKGGVGTSPGLNYSTLLGNNINLEFTGYLGTKHSNIHIDNNVFDGTAGAHVKLSVGATATITTKALAITGNSFFQNNLPNNTYPVVDIVLANSSVIGGLVVTNNAGIAVLYGLTTDAYSAFIAATGTGTIPGAIVANNHVDTCSAGVTGFTPLVGANQNVRTDAAGTPTAF